MPVPAKSPSDQLKEWSQALAENQSKNASLSKDIDRLKNQIANLSKTVSDVDQKKQAWAKSLQAAKDQQADLGAYVATKLPVLEAGLANAKAVKDAKAAGLKALDDQQASVQTAAKIAAQKQQDWSTAKQAAVDASNSYTSYANLASANDTVLKDLSSLRASAEKDGAVNNEAGMYFHILVMADQLKQLNLPAPEDYVAKLNDLAGVLATADETEKVAKIASDNAASDAAQTQKALDEARSSWRQKVHDSIPKGGAVPPASGPAQAPPAVTQAAQPTPTEPVAAQQPVQAAAQAQGSLASSQPNTSTAPPEQASQAPPPAEQQPPH